MSTGFWLQDNPPVNQQFRCPRRQALTGTVIVHLVADAGPGWVEPIAVARFIQRRPPCPNCGSYHHLVHYASDLALIGPECEAFQAETGSNQFAWSISFCCDPHELTLDFRNRPVEAERTDAALKRAGPIIARFAVDWATAQGNPARALTVARWIPGADANAGMPGMAEHWEVQEYNRQDLVRTNPERDAIRARLAGYVHDAVMALIEPEPPDEGDDEMGFMVQSPTGGILHVTGGAAVKIDGADQGAIDNYKNLTAAGIPTIKVTTEQFRRYSALVKS